MADQHPFFRMSSRSLYTLTICSTAFFSLIFMQASNMASGSETPQSKSSASEAIQPIQVSPGVYDCPLVVSKSLEPRREEFKKDMLEAQRRLRAFAGKNGWEELTSQPLIKQVEIFDSKEGWDNRLREFCPKDEVPAVIPKTFTAGVEKDIFFSVSPEIYFENYPDGRNEPDAFIKLMTHELAHRLHVRICHGDENRMGPIWFWEGFAVYAADQLNFDPPKLSNAEIWAIVDAKDRGSYRKYNVVFRHFLRGSTLPDYVKRAGEPDFTAWLKERG